MKKALLLTLALAGTGFAPVSLAVAKKVPYCEQLLKLSKTTQARFGIYQCRKLCLLIDFDDRGTEVPCDKVSTQVRSEFGQ